MAGPIRVNERRKRLISNAEMDRRWTAVRDVMAKHDIDWIIATTGHPWGYYRWLTNRVGLGGPYVAIGMEGAAILASHGDEVHHQPQDSYGVHHVASCSQLNVMANSHAPLLVAEMKAAGKPIKRIGYAGTSFVSVAADKILHDAFPDAEFVDVTDSIARLKAHKSAEELALMKEAAAMHDASVGVALDMVRPGVTAGEVVEEIRRLFTNNGSKIQTMMGGSAPYGEICRYAGPADRVMEAGDTFVTLIECSMASGYYSEVMPTICLGDPSPEHQKAFNDVIEIQNALVEAVRPGMLPSELLTMCDKMMVQRGYPGERRLLGHSQGLDLVERPAFSPLGENLSIEHDMVISIHPTVHAPKAWGLPINISFHFSENGMERMLETPNEIFVVH